MSITVIGDAHAADGLNVLGAIQVGGATVIDANGKIIESAGIEIADGDTFDDTNSNEVLEWGVTASAVNHLKITNEATSKAPSLTATGTDANINLALATTGTGKVVLGNSANDTIIQSAGDRDITLQTGNSTTGDITITDGANGNVSVSPNGSGVLLVDSAIRSEANVGTPGTNVTAVHYGDGFHHVTVLTLTATDLGAPTAGGNSAHGALIYTFPAGTHLHSVSHFNVGLTLGGVTTDTPDVGLGSLIGSGANATLNAVGATAEDYITGQTWGVALDGTATEVGPLGATAGIHTGISLNAVGDTKAVNFNAADGWNAGVTGNLTADGVVVLHWTKIS